MKKVKNIILIAIALLLIITVMVYKSTRPRDYEKMEHLAEIKFHEKIDNRNIIVDEEAFYRLPPRDIQDKGMVFSWYSIIESGDSAILNIQVNKQGKFLQDEQFRVTMNRSWGYLFNPKSKYINILPLKYKGDSLFLERVVLFKNQDEYLNSTDSLQLLIPIKELFSFLKKGYFSVLERYEDNTVVAFYEPIAKIISENESKPILTGKVFFTDRNEVLIFPYDAPEELWDNYNKE